MARILVIGAGMGGMAAAARLARLGHDVTVVEQSSSYGGKLGVYQRDGHRFDTGPSLLTLPQIYRDLFADTGADLDKLLDIIPVDPTCRYRFPDGVELDLPHAGASVPLAIRETFGDSAAQQWQALMNEARHIWDLVGEPVLQRPLGGVRDLVRRSASIRDLTVIAPWRTLRTVGEHRLDDPRLRMLLDRYATYCGSDPRRTPAIMTVVPYVEQRFGGWYIQGGLRRLADTLFQHCTALGVRFLFNTPVRSVEVGATRATGLRLTDGAVLTADVVISNADAYHLYQDLVVDRRARGARRALRKVQPSLSGFVLLLALRGRTDDHRHHRVLFPADYDAEFDALFGRQPAPVTDPTIYISAPDDVAVRPRDGESWFVLVNAPRHDPEGINGVDWERDGLANAYADRILDLMAKRGIDVRDRVHWRVVRTPADLARDTLAIGGSIYGSSSNGPRAALLRPANRSPVPGLFLVGGSAHPGGGLPLVAMSAGIVASLIGHA